MKTTNKVTLLDKPSLRRYLPVVRKMAAVVVAALVALATIGSAIVALCPSCNPLNRPSYPAIGGTWDGTLTILTLAGPTGDVHLVLRQQDAHIEGTMTFAPPLSTENDGTLSGTVTTDDRIEFSLANTAHSQTLTFAGIVSRTGDQASGTYTSTHGYSGTWQLARSAIGYRVLEMRHSRQCEAISQCWG